MLKNLLPLSVFFLLFPFSLTAQKAANDIIGIWVNEEETSHIEIYEDDGLFFGKIDWMIRSIDDNGEPFKDKRNPDPELQDRPIQGLIIISRLRYKNGVWKGGKIYSPKRGITANCNALIDESGRLNLKVSKSIFSQTKYFTRLPK